MVHQSQGPAGAPPASGSDLGVAPTSSSMPLAPPALSRSSSAVSVASASSAEHHHGGGDGPHRRSPSFSAAGTLAAAASSSPSTAPSGPTLVHPLPQVGTISNRPPALQLETSNLSNLWWAQDDQSRGRSTEIEVSPNRSATSSPVSRFHSPITAKASADHLLHPSSQSSTLGGSAGGSHAHHAPSNLRHSRVPSLNSPPQQTTSFPALSTTTAAASAARQLRPGLVSQHSHLQPDAALPWPQRLRLACTSPDTGRWQMPQVLTPYVPFMAWAGTSLGFVVVFTFWRQELFTGLDTMSVSLAEMGLLGKTIMGACLPGGPPSRRPLDVLKLTAAHRLRATSLGLLIFLTCFPPLPLYSTLIILSGYAFGAWDGFVISYIAALSVRASLLCADGTLARRADQLLRPHHPPRERSSSSSSRGRSSAAP